MDKKADNKVNEVHPGEITIDATTTDNLIKHLNRLEAIIGELNNHLKDVNGHLAWRKSQEIKNREMVEMQKGLHGNQNYPPYR